MRAAGLVATAATSCADNAKLCSRIAKKRIAKAYELESWADLHFTVRLTPGMEPHYQQASIKKAMGRLV